MALRLYSTNVRTYCVNLMGPYYIIHNMTDCDLQGSITCFVIIRIITVSMLIKENYYYYYYYYNHTEGQ
jgi:hypothetical protein